MRLAAGAISIPPATTTPTQGDLLAANAPPAEAEYIGAIAAGIIHPRAWTESMTSSGSTDVTPAMKLIRKTTSISDRRPCSTTTPARRASSWPMAS